MNRKADFPQNSLLSLLEWWDSLSDEWQRLIVDHLELQGYFSKIHLEYVFTITELDMTGYEIYDLNPLAMLQQIEKLDISNAVIKNVEVLASMPKLKVLDACFMEVENWEILSQIPSLKVLDVSYPKVLPSCKFSILNNLPQLKELYCNHCGVGSISNFMGMPELQVLSICFNPISESEIELYEEIRTTCKLIF